MSERIYLNRGWRFTEKYTEELLNSEHNIQAMQEIEIPHTVKETPLHYFDESIYQMESAYIRKLEVPEEWANKDVLITFEGVAHESEVFLNGTSVGKHSCGYTAYTINLREELRIGETNTLLVRVDSREDLNIPPFGNVVDYMTYGGIYRDVYIDIEELDHITDVFVKAFPEVDKSAELKVEVSFKFDKVDTTDKFYIRQSLRQWKRKNESGNIPYAKEIVLGEREISNDEDQIETEYKVNDIELWNISAPHLYLLKTQLYKNEELISEKDIRFGFRKAEFRADGFYLNERKTKIFGVNRHQSYAYVGYAMPASMQRLDADILKHELQLNAVRTSHYPQSQYFIDRCDELGLMVFTEIPGWQHIGDEKWKEQAIINTEDMVRQYRNHPSIVLWGVRINESPDDDEFYTRTNAVAHRLDTTRATGGVRCIKNSNLLEDVYTYNDFVHDGKAKGAEPKKNVTSDMNKAYLVSEYGGHMYPTKSFDCEEHILEHAIRHATVINDVRANSDIAGSFAWCMFDYNTHKDFGSGDRICYHGIMDMFRNEKLAASVYSSQATRRDVLEISSSMDIGEHPGSNRGKVYAFTNADSVKMYKNDRFISEFSRDSSQFKCMKHGPILIDDYVGDQLSENEKMPRNQARAVKNILNSAAVYGMGALPIKIYLDSAKAIVRYGMRFSDAVSLYNKYIGDWGGTVTTYRFEAIRDGKVVKTQIKGAVKEISLVAEADHTILSEDHTYDVAAVRIKAVDQNGNRLPFADMPLRLKLEGDARLIGPDVVSLKGGMAGTYIRTVGRTGDVKLTIETEGTDSVEIEFKVV